MSKLSKMIAEDCATYRKRIAELEAALAAIVKRGGHMSGGVAHELVVIARKALTSVTSDKP